MWYYREGYESEDFPEDPLATPRDERQASQAPTAAQGNEEAALVPMPASDDITPPPADFTVDSEQFHAPVGSIVAAEQHGSAQGSRRTLKSILKTSGKVFHCMCLSRPVQFRCCLCQKTP